MQAPWHDTAKSLSGPCTLCKIPATRGSTCAGSQRGPGVPEFPHPVTKGPSVSPLNALGTAVKTNRPYSVFVEKELFSFYILLILLNKSCFRHSFHFFRHYVFIVLIESDLVYILI